MHKHTTIYLHIYSYIGIYTERPFIFNPFHCSYFHYCTYPNLGLVGFCYLLMNGSYGTFVCFSGLEFSTWLRIALNF